MAINFVDLIAVQRGNALNPESFRLLLPRTGVKAGSYGSGESKGIEIKIAHYLDFSEIFGIVADFVVTFDTPLPITRLELVQVCQRWIVEFGRYKGIDYEKVNKHTLYASKIRVAKLFSDLFKNSKIPLSVLDKPEDYDPALCQFKREIIKLGCDATLSDRHRATGEKRKCPHLESYICIMNDGRKMRLCHGHWRWELRMKSMESFKEIPKLNLTSKQEEEK